MSDPTRRFSDKVGDYARYRPSYPEGLLADLDRLAWTSTSVIADIGAGTGLWTRLVAPRVARVVAVEPNGPMRTQGVAESGGLTNVEWIDATGEATGLPDGSLDAITCAQAFHWLDAIRAAVEWRRVLKPGAPVVLLWNERDQEDSNLQRAYEELLNRWCPDYPKVNHKNVTVEGIQAFFAPYPVTVLKHPNDQRFDLEGWKGRLRSASYCPRPQEPGHEEMMSGLDGLFRRFHDPDGLMTFPYRTTAYLSRLT